MGSGSCKKKRKEEKKSFRYSGEWRNRSRLVDVWEKRFPRLYTSPTSTDTRILLVVSQQPVCTPTRKQSPKQSCWLVNKKEKQTNRVEKRWQVPININRYMFIPVSCVCTCT
jgi:hypothetical protein